MAFKCESCGDDTHKTLWFRHGLWCCAACLRSYNESMASRRRDDPDPGTEPGPEFPPELLQMADDGCPHADPTVAVAAIAADIPGFVNSGGAKTYCLFVPFTPTILRCMIGKDFCVSIDPFTMNGVSGSMVETMCEKDIVALWKRFYPQTQEHDDGTQAKD